MAKNDNSFNMPTDFSVLFDDEETDDIPVTNANRGNNRSSRSASVSPQSAGGNFNNVVLQPLKPKGKPSSNRNTGRDVSQPTYAEPAPRNYASQLKQLSPQYNQQPQPSQRPQSSSQTSQFSESDTSDEEYEDELVEFLSRNSPKKNNNKPSRPSNSFNEQYNYDDQNASGEVDIDIASMKEADKKIIERENSEKQKEERERAIVRNTVNNVSTNNFFSSLSECLGGDEKNISVCHSIISERVKGFKAFFVGEKSSTIIEAKEGIKNILYRMGKIDSPEIEELSFSELENINEWNPRKFYVVKDLKDAIINLFSTESDQSADQVQAKYRRMLNKLLNSPSNIYLILECDSSDYIGFSTIDPRIRFKFEKKCVFPDISDDLIADRFYNEITVTENKPSKQEIISFLENNRRFFPFKNNDLVKYLAEYFDLNGALPVDKYEAFDLEKAFSQIVGMEDTKKAIGDLARLLRSRKKLKDIGMNPNLIPIRASTILTGPAGSGKTTLARILAHLYFDMGLLPEDKLVEISSSDLIAGDAGLTERKTNKVIQDALGGALFLDECYSLADAGSAGMASLALLIKAMEDYRDRFVCIFAGYKKEVNEKFLPMNSGLDSRCTFYDLKPYSVLQLLEIYKLKLRNIGVTLDESPDTISKLNELLKYAYRNENRGQGRFVERIVQSTMVVHVEYIEEHPEADPLIISEGSIPPIELVVRSNH